MALHVETALVGEILNFLLKPGFLKVCFRLLSLCPLGLPAFSFLLLFYALATVHAGLTPGSPIALNVYFDYNSDRILSVYSGDLDKLGRVLVLPEYLDFFIAIEGHVDSSGSMSYNQRLSERRAESVKRYLVQHFPISSERLIVRGYGNSRPIATSSTPGGRSKNNRIEVVRIGRGLSEALIASSEAWREEEADARRAGSEALWGIGMEADDKVVVSSLSSPLQALEVVDPWNAEIFRWIGFSHIESEAEVTAADYIQALQDDHVATRLSAAMALSGFETEVDTIIPPLIQALQDPEMSVRQAAAGTLRDIGAKAKNVVPALIQVLQDPEVLVRLAAAESLGKLGPQAHTAIPTLSQALEDHELRVRWTAAGALSNIGVQAIPALIKALPDQEVAIRVRIAESLGKLGPQAHTVIPALIQALQDPEEYVRRAAAHALGNRNNETETTIPALIQALQDPKTPVRRTAARALGRIGEPSIPALIQVLENSQAIAHWAAMNALARIGAPAVPALIRELQNRKATTRLAAAVALGDIGAEAKVAIPYLGKALKSPELHVRQAAVWALERIGPGEKAAVPTLIQALQDPAPTVRLVTARVLGGIGPVAKAAVPTLIQALQDPDLAVRQQVADVLRRVGPDEQAVVRALSQALLDSEGTVRMASADSLCHIGSLAVPTLIQLLQASEITVRLAAAWALGCIGIEARGAVPALTSKLWDPEINIRQAVAQSLEAIGAGARAAMPALTQALLNEEIADDAAKAFSSITVDLQDKSNKLSIQELSSVIRELKKFLTALESNETELKNKNELTRSMNRSLDTLEVKLELKKKARFDAALEWIRQNKATKWVAGTLVYIVSLLSCCLALLWLRPLWLLQLNDVLKTFTDFTLPSSLGGIKIPVRAVLLVGFFHYHSRVLKAWVATHVPIVREAFWQKHTVKERHIYIPTPVSLDNLSLATLTGNHVRPVFSKRRGCLLIWGEGGVGKTSLACQIAKWAVANDEAERLCEHYMLPVLIEQELDTAVAQGRQPFIEAIRGQLQASVGETEPISLELLERLLRHQHVLVIVDHFSEMSEATRREIRPGHPDFPVNALVVTSRIEEPLDGVPKTAIKPLRIEGNRLSSFMEAYLRQRGKRDLFDDPEYFDACRRLSLMAGQRNITVLLAKLYAELMTSAKEGLRENDLPDNIPDLMLSYLNELNRVSGKDEPDNRSVHRDAKAIAWECLRQTFRPGFVKRDRAIVVLDGDNPEARLAYLEDRLRIVQSVGPAQDHLRFALDPLAEYLAGLQLVALNGDNTGLWHTFFERVDAISGSTNVIESFLLAVWDCCSVRGSEERVPAFVHFEFSRRVDLTHAA
jgi:HEAT repeat protein